MHPIDRLAAVTVKRGPRRLRIFPGGWGNLDAVARLDDVGPLQVDAPDITIDWQPVHRLDDRTTRDGTFGALTEVPEAAQVASVRMIEPIDGSHRLCLLMAAWNDHGYNTRQQLADELVARGVASLILEIPYYGARRTVGDDEQPIQTVGDFALMGLGAVTEGRALLNTSGIDIRWGSPATPWEATSGRWLGPVLASPWPWRHWRRRIRPAQSSSTVSSVAASNGPPSGARTTARAYATG